MDVGQIWTATSGYAQMYDMSLTDDLQQIIDVALTRDPSFRQIETALIDGCIDDCRRTALTGCLEGFLLSAMRLLALSDNGHTRLIPNDAISVLPLRLVSVGRSVHAMRAAAEVTAAQGELVTVNGAPVDQIAAAAERFLAGTQQRKRVIGSILLAWPYALEHLGFPSVGGSTTYRFRDADGRMSDLPMPHQDTVPASQLYPRSEHGRADAAWTPGTFAEVQEWPELGLCIRLPSFFDRSETALPKAISDAATRVSACSHQTLLIDVRGNTGGDFIKTLPLIDAISQNAPNQVAILVDKFTFSAAIVFVAILKHRLGDRLTLIGEEMGDGLRFFAEGGSLELRSSGAVVRYSTAFHDWEGGTLDGTTPPEIARHLVAADSLALDREWVEDPTSIDAGGMPYPQILRDLRA